MNYRKITSKIADHLSLPEAYTYLCLAMKSDRETLRSNINQNTLADIVGVDTRTIQRHLKKMEELSLIKKETINGNHNGEPFKKNRYTLTDEHYVLIDEQLIHEPIDRSLKGFLVLLKIRCWNNTNICYYSTKQLADTLTISKSSVDRYLNNAADLGYIEWDKAEQKITILNDKIFIKTREQNLFKRELHDIILD